MKDMYLFISEYEIQKYNGEVLKRYVGNRCVKIISNPTEEDLKEFGYKYLVEENPLEEKEGFYIETYYEDGEVITKKYRYVELPEEMFEEIIEEMEVRR